MIRLESFVRGSWHAGSGSPRPIHNPTTEEVLAECDSDGIDFGAVVAYAREKNRYEHKQLDFSVVTNMTWMTEEIAEYLIGNEIWVCTSLDGPAAIHDWNRGWSNGPAFDTVVKWIRYFNQRYIELGYDPELYHSRSFA